MDALPCYTLAQLAHIVEQLREIEVDGMPVFDVQVINAHNDETIALDAIQGFGMVYIRIKAGVNVRKFAVLVDVV